MAIMQLWGVVERQRREMTDEGGLIRSFEEIPKEVSRPSFRLRAEVASAALRGGGHLCA
jgi:hypothetical protein